MEKSNSKIFLIIISLVIIIQCNSDKDNLDSASGTNQFSELPDTEIYDFSYKYTKRDRMIWELHSKKAAIYNKNELIKIIGVNLIFYKNNNIDTKVESKFGKILEKQKFLTAISNVVLTTKDGDVLYTDILHWDNNKQLLFTDEYVKIIKNNGEKIEGVGMEADNNLEKLIIKHDVTGEFYEK